MWAVSDVGWLAPAGAAGPARHSEKQLMPPPPLQRPLHGAERWAPTMQHAACIRRTAVDSDSSGARQCPLPLGSTLATTQPVFINGIRGPAPVA